MKCSIPEISWHNREPVLSVDFQPINTTNNDFYRLATGGSDNLVLVWKLKIMPDGQVEITVLSELSRHQRSVNVVKWSPNGVILASGDDDANIILWKLKTDNIPSLDERENDFEEKWNAFKVLRGHKEDVYDLCWSPMSDKLLSGSVDNTAILWDTIKGTNEYLIKDHKGFVQGVAWDPKGDYLATLCSDRVCRVFERNGRRVRARITRGKLPVEESSEFCNKDVKFFHDDTFKTYFRRLDFSPDGSLLLVPSGAVETEEKKNALFGTFAFTLDSLNNPVSILPSGKQCSIAVRCCPTLFELRQNGPKPLINLPYRMIVAVATDSDVILYDTQQLAPCCHLQNIHYTRLTDLTWSVDGLLLAASSTDGFITLVTFEKGELGAIYVKDESDLEDSVLNVSGCDILAQDVDSCEDVKKGEEKAKKPSFLQQWAKTNERKSNKISEERKGQTRLKNELKFNSSLNASSTGKETEIAQVDLEVEEGKPEMKLKRITPILIAEGAMKKKVANLPPQKCENVEARIKRRIQPIKIGEVNSTKKSSADKILGKVSKEVVELVGNHMDVDEVIDLDDIKQTTIQIGKKDELNMPENCSKLKFMPKIEESEDSLEPKVQTPQNAKPQMEKTSSSKKKKTPVQPSNTLLNYMKPITKTPTMDGITIEDHSAVVETQKTPFKPQKLFDVITPTNGKLKTLAKVKVNVQGLVKTGASHIHSPNIHEDLELKVDEDVVILTDTREKENDTEVVSPELKNVASIKKLEFKAEAKRRIPLITLSSPKNKKKPKTAAE